MSLTSELNSVSTTDVNYWNGNSIVSVIITFFILLGMSVAIDKGNFERIFCSKSYAIIYLLALLYQVIIMPALGYAIGLAFNVKAQYLFAIIVTMSCPVGVLGNYFTFIMGGNQELSLLITLTSTALSFGNIPLNLYLYVTLGMGNSNNENYALFSELKSNTFLYAWDFYGAILGVTIVGALLGIFITGNCQREIRMSFIFVGIICVLARFIKMIIDYVDWRVDVGYTANDIFCPIVILLSSYLIPTTIIYVFMKKCPGNFFQDKIGHTDEYLFNERKQTIYSYAMEFTIQETALAIIITAINLQSNEKIMQDGLRFPIVYTTVSYVANSLVIGALYCLGIGDRKGNKLSEYDNLDDDTYEIELLPKSNENDDENKDDDGLEIPPIIKKTKNGDDSISLWDVFSYIQEIYVTAIQFKGKDKTAEEKQDGTGDDGDDDSKKGELISRTVSDYEYLYYVPVVKDGVKKEETKESKDDAKDDAKDEVKNEDTDAKIEEEPAKTKDDTGNEVTGNNGTGLMDIESAPMPDFSGMGLSRQKTDVQMEQQPKPVTNESTKTDNNDDNDNNNDEINVDDNKAGTDDERTDENNNDETNVDNNNDETNADNNEAGTDDEEPKKKGKTRKKGAGTYQTIDDSDIGSDEIDVD